MPQYSAYVKLLRPTNWVKNLIIGLPLLLSHKISAQTVTSLCIGMVCFSFLASGGYIINDIKDIEKDRLHEKKKLRPLAAGTAKVGPSVTLAIILIAAGLGGSLYMGMRALLVAVIYFSTNLFYSLYGKRLRFFDVLQLSFFYIIRVIYGSEIYHVLLTGWFMATLTMCVLALSVSKRYMECKISTNDQIPGRGYTKQDEVFLQGLMTNFALGSVLLLNIHAYFVLAILSPFFYVFLNLAAAGIIFFYFDHAKNKSDDPVERIIKNIPLLILVLFFIVLYCYEVILKAK